MEDRDKALAYAAKVAKRVTDTLRTHVPVGAAQEFAETSERLTRAIEEVDAANVAHLKGVIGILHRRISQLEQLLASVTENLCSAPMDD